MNALLRRQEKTSSIELTDDAVCKNCKFTKSDIYIIAGRDFSVKTVCLLLEGCRFARLPTGDTASFRFMKKLIYLGNIGLVLDFY